LGKEMERENWFCVQKKFLAADEIRIKLFRAKETKRAKIFMVLDNCSACGLLLLGTKNDTLGSEKLNLL